jgi:3-isopropylmalate dehydrogenase
VTEGRFRIAVLPGDGIGPEVIAPCLELLETAARRTGGFTLDFESAGRGEVDRFLAEVRAA